MFIDIAKIEIQAGRGGDGLTSFRREKYVERGGPNGGDGGSGGDIIFEADQNQRDLSALRFIKLLKSDDGQPGGRNHRRGKSGADNLVKVPVGTIVTDLETSENLADFTEKGEQVVIAKGGLGGFGNAHFKSSVRRAPRFAEKGLVGEHKQIQCELKLLAEVGLVGLPNAGKSTFLQVTTNARPKIGAYPFTTLEPHLGITSNNCLIADIPGLIAGAAEGKGLGHQFLRHIERNLVLLHLIDCQQLDVVASYHQIMTELEAYNPKLLALPQLIALTKIETLDENILESKLQALQAVLPDPSRLYQISALANINLTQLLTDLKLMINKSRRAQAKQQQEQQALQALPVFKLTDQDKVSVSRRSKDCFVVSGSKIETFAAKTNFDNQEACQRLWAIMRKWGIVNQLLASGCRTEKIVFGKENLGPLYLEQTIDLEDQS